MLSNTSREFNEQMQNSEVQVGLCLRHERSLLPYFIRGVHKGRKKERGLMLQSTLLVFKGTDGITSEGGMRE